MPRGDTSLENGAEPPVLAQSCLIASAALRCWLSSFLLFLLKLFLNLLSLYFILQLKVLLPPHPFYLTVAPGLSLFSMTGRAYAFPGVHRDPWTRGVAVFLRAYAVLRVPGCTQAQAHAWGLSACCLAILPDGH